ncbi:hypothetical protein [Candidatus Solincola sp.]|nr:hypothetical protein [Actinomycetota bacterium]
MIGDKKLLEKFEREFLRNDRPTLEENFRLLDAMWEEAVYFRVLPPPEPLQGIEVDLRIAKIVNSV